MVGTRQIVMAIAVLAALCLAGFAAWVLLVGGEAGGQVEHGGVSFDLSPDGKKAVFSSAGGHMFLLNLDTLAVTALAETNDSKTSPTFSPDGKWIAYAASANGEKNNHIFVRSLDGKTVRQLTHGDAVSDGAPAFSSDGARIVFARAHRYRPYSMGGWTWDDYDIAVMDRDGSRLRRITEQKYYQAGGPRFLRGDERIVFAAHGQYPDSSTYLFTVAADGSRPPERLAPPPAPPPSSPSDPQYFAVWGNDPRIAPGGERLVFISDRAGSFDYDLWVMGVDGTDPRPLHMTGISTYNQEPVFTPDGQGILFLAGAERNRGGRAIYSLWRVGADGKDPRRIADSGLFTDPNRWKPKP